ncbi:MAG: MBOAT family O-acyltransferase, partial [Saprospiraceae bacterium]
EFWGGWHRSLNEWFRDYFFYERIRYDKKRKYTNLLLFITFTCIALWHDFTTVFLVWGLLNATWLIAERNIKKYGKTKGITFNYPYLGILYHSLISSFLATIFIAEDLPTLFNTFFGIADQSVASKGTISLNLIFTLFVFLVMDFYERKAGVVRMDVYLAKLSPPHRYFFYYFIGLLIFVFALNPRMTNYYNLF